jgi:hypothetical protein
MRSSVGKDSMHARTWVKVVSAGADLCMALMMIKIGICGK